ncbi:uncharacterized membrane protein (DUF485 family) [Agromyces hippuratus]|uniref:Uncharacterized membrane protein (DUF485 family) n=1 Tax=Agromyces hippuratus TaxID=286438 RepID=A0A852WRL9_9MICO|nr:DUF3159 domain-containing protein [Agromyces hippuratus]NYG20208.1 uncharacterized membrane protein (DUF485 family) [Agromyces hippuratus]
MTNADGPSSAGDGERADGAAEHPAETDGAPGTADSTATAGEFGRQFAAAAEKSGLGALARDEKLSGRDLLTAVGGVRGILEALLPGLVFLIVYSGLTSFAGQDPQAALVPALVASVGLAVIFTVARLVVKGQPTQAIAGLIGVLASAALALWSGDARDNYVIGFYTNAAYALGLTVSLLVGWPAIGLIVGFLMGDGVAWKQDKRKYRAAQFLTLVWIGLFVARLAVQLPFYLANNVEALGATRLIMGVPLYALVLVFSWLVVRAIYPSSARSGE